MTSRKNPIAKTLEDLITQLETDSAPCDEEHFSRSLSGLGLDFKKRDQPLSFELIAEDVAFLIRAHDGQDSSEWGLYFGPFMGSTPLEMITAEVLAYWGRRAHETPHPIMRARYADLLWEIPKKLEGAKSDHAMARVAIDAYLRAIEEQRYKPGFTAIQKGKRALRIALSLGDKDLVERAKNVLLKLEDAVAEDDKLGLWGFCFDIFLLELTHKDVLLTDIQRDKLVADLEARLAQFAKAPPSQRQPFGAQAAALRLANYYRRLERNDDVARVLRVYAEIVRKMHRTAAPLLFAVSLERLHRQFKRFELHKDADDLNELLRVAGEETIADLEPVTVVTEIPSEKVEAYFSAMLTGTGSEVVRRIATHYIPKRQEAEEQLRRIAQDDPFSFSMATTIKDDEGRTIAQVGPLESDFEGQLRLHISQDMHFKVPWLRGAMTRGLESGLLSLEIFLNFLMASSLFPQGQLDMLEAGLTAYIRGDSMATIHILIPQVEQALRQLAKLIKAPIYKSRRGGVLHLRIMDDLLQDESIGRALGEDVVTYLRVLLTDARGWNVRNNVCHGLAPASTLTMHVADRVVHALLVLASIRNNEDSPAA